MAAAVVVVEDLATILSPLLEDETASSSSSASLFLARNLAGDTVVLKRTRAKTKEAQSSAQNEVSLLRRIRHPNIVAFCGVWTRPLSPGTEINLLIELCAGGNLLELQRRREQSGRPLTEQEIVRLFVQCCRGVECLHRFDPPVAHRDVKLENLVLGGADGRMVKLCDLGSATTRRVLVVSREDRVKLEDEVVRLTTPVYRAPELVDFYSRKLVSEQVDVWSLGCVLFALGFSRHLFAKEGEMVDRLAVLSGKVAVPREPYYSDEFQLVLHWLLEGDPNIRPRIGDVVDELDLLLGNKVKVAADKRGSGSGFSRSSCKLACLSSSPVTVEGAAPAPAKPSSSPRQPQQATPTRGAAYVPAAAAAAAAVAAPSSATPSSARGVRKPQPPPSTTAAPPSSSTNPFDSSMLLLPPSTNLAFFSNPGLTSDSIAGFSSAAVSALAPGGSPFPSSASIASSAASSSLSFAAQHQQPPPSQAPVFYSDPPPQWRPGKT